MLALKPLRVGGSLDQWWRQYVGVLCYPAVVGDAEVLHGVLDSRDS